jgi:hypothetical protein
VPITRALVRRSGAPRENCANEQHWPEYLDETGSWWVAPAKSVRGTLLKDLQHRGTEEAEGALPEIAKDCQRIQIARAVPKSCNATSIDQFGFFGNFGFVGNVPSNFLRFLRSSVLRVFAFQPSEQVGHLLLNAALPFEPCTRAQG